MKKKILYESPTSRIIEVSLEGIMTNSMSDNGTENFGRDPEDDL